MFKKYLDYFFIAVLISTMFIPELGVVDIINIQFLYLIVTQGIIFSYLFFFKKDSITILKVWSSKILISYFLFIIICGISILNSFNKTESIIDFSYYLTIFLTILNYTFIFIKNEDKLKLFLFFIITLLALESLFTFWIFLSNYNFENGLNRVRDLQGFSYNQNINAFSLAIKLPILIYFSFKLKNKFFYILAVILFVITTFDILIIASRGAIIALFVVFASTILYILGVFKIRMHSKKMIVLIFLFGITLILQNFLYQKNDELKATVRIANYDDSSVSYRKNLYFEALEGMRDFPLTGVGIGNWKIVSIGYAKDRIQQYQVPYHVHNDFLHIGAETGIIGFIIFVFIFFQIFYTLFILFKKRDNSLLFFFLALSIIVYFLDSSFNFPRARIYSQVNIILFISFIVGNATIILNSKKLFFKNVNYLILIFLPFGTFISYKVYKSSIIQKKIIYDFNENPSKYIIPISEIEEVDPTFPTISSVTFPLKSSLAFYQIQNGEYEKAIKNAIEGNIYNPYLGLMEHQLAKIYLEYDKIRNIDSAYKYAKISVEKLPLNSAHNSILQMVLAQKGNINEARLLFEVAKKAKNEIIWQNYIIYNTKDKYFKNEQFDDYDKEIIKEALLLFPKNNLMKLCDKIINFGEGLILLANEYDTKAINAFQNKDFEIAIENWEQAIKIIDNDDSYYLNIAQSYLSIQKNKEAFETLKKIEEKKLVALDGKYEYLMGMYYLSLQNSFKACEYFNKGLKLGSVDSANATEVFGCKRN